MEWNGATSDLVLKAFQLLLVLGCCALPPIEGTYYSCPPLEPDMGGACVEACSTHSDCSANDARTHCCYNGCGHTCMEPFTVPYHSPALVCPELVQEVAGTCSEECSSGNHTTCNQEEEEGQLCCSNGCGHVCVGGVTPDLPCVSLRDRILGDQLIGSYVPQCEEDGSFSPVQCHGSTGYCWCVANDTGVPLSDMLKFEMPQCNCTYNQLVFSVGDVFPSADTGSCDTCSCTVRGEVSCVHRECPEVERGAGVFYSCPAVRADPADQREEDCGKAECLLHSDCPSHLKCCYDGCGYSCTEPSRIPYIDLVSAYSDECPPAREVPCTDREEEEESESESEREEWEESNSESDEEWEESCVDEDFTCDPNELCCANECGWSVCVPRWLENPCLMAVALALNTSRSSSGATLLGSYTPLCTTDGLFREIQCHTHYCWCVNRDTGVPLSDIVPFEEANVLACAACVYNGKKYRHLERFPAADSCNTCTCVGGTISCSGVACGDGDYEGDDEDWEWWHSVLIGCVVVVVLLVSVVLVLLVGIMFIMKQNSPHRHHRLKDSSLEDCEHELVEYRTGQDSDSVELKVPMEDITMLSPREEEEEGEEGEEDNTAPVKA